MDARYYQRNGQRGNHFGPTVVYSRPLVHNPMPASHNYVRNGTTEKAKGYEAWVASRGKEDDVYANDEAYIEDECDEKEFAAAEATEGYPNMRQAVREEDNMMMKNPAFVEDEYDDDDVDEKVFTATEPTKGYTNMRPGVGVKDDNMYARNPMFSEGDQHTNKVFAATDATKGYPNMMRQGVREKDDSMYARNPMFGEGDQYSNKMYPAEASNGYSNMRQPARPKEDNTFALNPALTDDEYNYNTYSPEPVRGYMNTQKPARQKEDLYAARPVHGGSHQQMYPAEAGRGYMNFRQGGRRKEEVVYAVNPVLSDDDYGQKIYSADAGRGYMNARQTPRRREDNMYALNPALSDDDYNYKVYSTPAVQGYANMRHGAKEDSMFVSNQAYGRADFGGKVYYKPSHMEPSKTKKAVTCGPWGGSTGNLFDDGVFTGVREIELTRSGSIVSIRVCYDMEGKAVWGSKNGGSHGMKVDKIVFDHQNEYLTHISGYYGSMMFRGPTVLKALTFHTNRRKYGPFGEEQGISFSSAGLVDGKIVGFNGRIKNWYIESIGVHVMEATTARDAFNMSGLRMRLEW